jgi:glucosamine kinase
MNTLIADSGSTKCEWCLLHNGKKKRVDTVGISPYFLDAAGIGRVLDQELLPALKKLPVDEIYYYGTGAQVRRTGKSSHRRSGLPFRA